MPSRSLLGRPVRVVLMAAVLLAGAVNAGAQENGTTGVFRRFADQVVKIQVIEAGSAARASIGSGFHVSDRGHIVTNYHVVAQVVHDPQRYRAELVLSSGATRPVTILALDVVHDLAVLGSDERSTRYLSLLEETVSQGDRLYSLGHPNDLGLSIVEGTYNGHLRHTLYPKIHFTGSINPGMSGGPTITADGRLVGVNVATSGNQVSFLVPGDRVAALLAPVLAPGYRPPASLLAEVGRQIHEYQDEYLREMFTGPTKHVEMGRYRVATEPAPFFRCWGDSRRNAEQPYASVFHRCSTDDYLYIAGDQYAGVVELSHQHLSSRTLNAARFYSLYTSVFQQDNTPGGSEEHVTSWRCSTRNVRNEALPMRSVLCLRRYRKLDGLYDAVLKVAVLGDRDSGLVSTLTLSGVSSANVERLTARYLEQIAWR
jgi:serine protease Do